MILFACRVWALGEEEGNDTGTSMVFLWTWAGVGTKVDLDQSASSLVFVWLKRCVMDPRRLMRDCLAVFLCWALTSLAKVSEFHTMGSWYFSRRNIGSTCENKGSDEWCNVLDVVDHFLEWCVPARGGERDIDLMNSYVDRWSCPLLEASSIDRPSWPSIVGSQKILYQ